MLYIILSICSLLLDTVWILTIYKKEINIIKLLAMGSGMFVAMYTLVSVCLLSLDSFSVKSASSILAVVLFAVLCVTILLNRKPNFRNIDWNIKKYVPLLCIIAVALLVTALKSVPVAPLFDSGCYCAKAIQLLEGDAKTVVELKEYSMVNSETVREELLELQDNQVGIYQVSADDTSYYYEYHGLPTWPALLALSGAMFGLENMSLILSFILVIVLSSIYFIMENIGVKESIKNLAFIIFAVSPLTLYLYKLPLSEGIITCFFVLSLFLLSEKEHSIKYLAIISIGVLCVSHISLFMYFPIFFTCLFLLYLSSQDKTYAIINLILCVELDISLLYAYKVSKVYLDGNFGTRIKGVDTQDLLTIIVIMTVICMTIQVVAILLGQFQKKKFDKVSQKLSTVFLILVKVVLVLALLYSVYMGYKIGFTDKVEIGVGSWRFRELYVNKGFSSIARLNFVNIAMALGWLSFPILIIQFLRKKHMTVLQTCINSIWIYALSIYTFIQYDTPINYSASRYFFIVLIPAAIIGLGCIIESKKQMILMAVIAIFVSIPFNSTLLMTKEYSGNVQFLEDTASIIEKNACVLVNLEDSTFISYNVITNLREMNYNKVFNYESFEEIEDLSEYYKIYYITSHECENEQFELISEKAYIYIGELYSLNVIYPLEAGKASQRVYIYRYVDE